MRVCRLGPQAPLWYIPRKTPGSRKSSGSNTGMPEIAVRPSGSRSDLTMLRRSVRIRRPEPMRPFPSSAGVWREAYQSGACETTRGIRISLRHPTIHLDHGGNPDSPGVSRRRTPNAPRQSVVMWRRELWIRQRYLAPPHSRRSAISKGAADVCANVFSKTKAKKWIKSN